MNITIRPLGRGRFAASVGQRRLCQSKTPFFTAARLLQAEGLPDDTSITMAHEGSSIVSLKSTVGEASRWIVVETDTQGPKIKRYRPMSPQMALPRVRDEARAAICEAEVGRARKEPEQLSL